MHRSPPWASSRALSPEDPVEYLQHANRPFSAVPSGDGRGGYVAATPGPRPQGKVSLNLPEAIGHAVAVALKDVQLNVRQPAYAQRTTHSRPFDVCQVGASVAIGDAAFVTVLTLFPGASQIGVIHSLGLALENDAAFGDVQWRIAYSGGGTTGVPIEGFGDIRCQLGTIANPTEVGIKLDAQRQIFLQAISLTVGVPHFARARAVGWIVMPRKFNGLRTPETWLGD